MKILFLLILVYQIQPVYSHGRGMYETKEKAIERSIEIGCTGYHQIDKKWMPCENESELHRALRKL
jgi:hypothetical protein